MGEVMARWRGERKKKIRYSRIRGRKKQYMQGKSGPLMRRWVPTQTGEERALWVLIPFFNEQSLQSVSLNGTAWVQREITM